MVLITASTTAPVNPPGANPVLTHDDLWTALVAKARHPEEFVAVIEKSRVIHEDAYGLTRGVTFKGDMGNGGEMEEVIKYFGKMKIDFFVPQTGQSVSNIISASSSSEGQDLYLTFTFEWYHPELQPGSAEAQEIETKRTAMSRQVVPHTVAVARTMKAEGRLH